MSIHVLDLRTGKEKLLLDDVAQAWYLPSGHLLVRATGRRGPGGAIRPRALRDHRARDAGARRGAGLASTAGSRSSPGRASGSLVYVQGAGGSTDNVMVRVSRDGAITPIDTAWHGEFNSIALSPEGRRLAVGVGSGAALNIWIKQLDRGPSTRLTFGGQDRRPSGPRTVGPWPSSGTAVARARSTPAPPTAAGKSGCSFAWTDSIQEGEWSHDGRWILVRTDNGQPARATSWRCPGRRPARPAGGREPVHRAATPRCHRMAGGWPIRRTSRESTRCTCGRSRTPRAAGGRSPTAAGPSRAGLATGASCSTWTAISA